MGLRGAPRSRIPLPPKGGCTSSSNLDGDHHREEGDPEPGAGGRLELPKALRVSRGTPHHQAGCVELPPPCGHGGRHL